MNTTEKLAYLVIELDSKTWEKLGVYEFDNYVDAETAAQLGNATQKHKYIVVNPISL